MEILTFGDTSILNGQSDYDANNECRRDCGDCRDCNDCTWECPHCENDDCNDCYRDTSEEDDCSDCGAVDCYWDDPDYRCEPHCEWND